MMRTSVSQFEFMVQFMLRNGDLNRTSSNPHGRIKTIRKWEELTTALNLDATGTSKTVEKWKKVWSDLKNNTKKKAQRIAIRDETPGAHGPSAKLALSSLEQEVLKIAGYNGSPATNGVVIRNNVPNGNEIRASTSNGDNVNVDVFEVLEQSVDSNDSVQSVISDNYEADQTEIDQLEQETVETMPHETVQVEIIDEVKKEEFEREDSPEFISEMETSVINETNKLFAKIIEQELVLVPKRRRIECMQEILGVIKKHNK